MNEVWKDIKGYEGLYQVSSEGRIRSLRKNRILSVDITPNGYIKKTLYKNGKGESKLVHRLVAEAFIPNPDNLPQINHKDECKTNNCVENLEWSSIHYNLFYGTRIERIKKNNKGVKPSQKAIDRIR